MTDIDPTAWRWVASSPAKKHKIKNKIKNSRSQISNSLTKYFGFGPLAKKTLKNVIFNSTAQIISGFGAAIFAIVIARLLRPEGYGTYTLVMAVAAIFVIFADLGINGTMVRYVARALSEGKLNRARSYYLFLLKFKFVLAGIISVLLVFVAKPIANYLFSEPELAFFFKIAAILVFVSAVLSYLESTFQARQAFKYVILSRTIRHILRLTFVVLAIYVGCGLIGIFFGIIGAIMCTILLMGYLFFLNNKFFVVGKITHFNKKKLLKFFGWLSICSAMGAIFVYVDSLMIGAMLSVTSVGYYNAAHTIVFAVISLVTTSEVLFPVFSKSNKGLSKKSLAKVVKWSLIYSVPPTIFMMFAAKPIILNLYGFAYYPSISIALMLSPLIILYASGSLYGLNIVAMGRADLYAKLIISSVAANVLLNYFMIKVYGLIGAAIATVLAQISLVFFCILAWKKIK